MSVTDPFTAVEAKLWELVADHTDLMALVKPGNRLDAQDVARRAQKEGRLSADLPELQLVPTGGGVTGWTSTSVLVSQIFDFQVLTGNERAYKELFPVRWQLLRAWAMLRKDQTWARLGLPYVNKVSLASFSDIQNGTQADTNKTTWASALQFTIDMTFDQQALETQSAPA